MIFMEIRRHSSILYASVCLIMVIRALGEHNTSRKPGWFHIVVKTLYIM